MIKSICDKSAAVLGFLLRYALSIGLLAMFLSLLVSDDSALDMFFNIFICIALIAGLIESFVTGRNKLKKFNELKARATAKADVTRR